MRMTLGLLTCGYEIRYQVVPEPKPLRNPGVKGNLAVGSMEYICPVTYFEV